MIDDFSEGQIAIIEKVGWRIGDIVAKRICLKMNDKIRLHTAECSVKKEVEAIRNIGRGGWTTGRTMLMVLAWIVTTALAIYGALKGN